MKARAEGEVAANPLGDLSPFSPPCVDFHFTPSLCRLHFRSSRERLCFLLRHYCGSIPSSKTVECCKMIFVPQATSFQCSACRLLLSCIAFSLPFLLFAQRIAVKLATFLRLWVNFFIFLENFSRTRKKLATLACSLVDKEETRRFFLSCGKPIRFRS